MKTYVSALRSAYPDFWVEIDQIGTCDVNSIFVTYNGSATNLGEYHSHKPSRHTSNFQGCNLVKFNDDRSRITEVLGEWWEGHIECSAKAAPVQGARYCEVAGESAAAQVAGGSRGVWVGSG